MIVSVEQNTIMLTNSGMEKNQNISLKCFSILAFKSRQKIHSSLKDDEGLNLGPTNIHIAEIFIYYTPKVKTVLSMILDYQVTFYSKLLEQIQHLTGSFIDQAW